MKKVLFSLVYFVTLFLNAQDFKEYYVVVKEGKSIEPITKSLNSNGKISLTFESTLNHLQLFFENKNVLKYEKAFPTAKTPLLKRTYIVWIANNEDFKNQFQNFQEIQLIEELFKPVLLIEPNDYILTPNNANFPCTPNASTQSQLDLIRAPLAWEITEGNENIVVGMSDNPLNPFHEDLVNKIIQNYAGVSYDHYAHGTLVAGCIASETNNGIGISAIGNKTKIISHAIGDQQMLLLSQMPNVKVINASWGNCYGSTTVQTEVYNEIWNNGVLVVAAAGNGNYPCGNPNNYLYPDYYDLTK